MAKRMLIDAAHPEETRVVVLSGNRLEEFDFESSTKKQVKGNIYLAKVTRVEPSLQAAFVDYGNHRHGFLAFSEIHPDYYKIPVSDRDPSEAEPVHEKTDTAETLLEAADADVVSLAAALPEPVVVPAAPEGAEDETTDAAPAAELRVAEASDPPLPVPETPPTPEARVEELGGIDIAIPAELPWETVSYGVDLLDEKAEALPRDHGDSSRIAAAGNFDETVASVEESPPVVGDSFAEGDNEGVEPVETLGGDELEEAEHQRSHTLRHYKIQEVIKRRQIMLVQVTKEERGNKGAALTTYLSLAGRYCVLMPNTGRGGGVSRKITNLSDRRRLKDILEELDIPEGMGVIVRTAGAERSKAEIKRDYEYLLRLWNEIRDLTLRSSAPALIYEEGDLIKRAIRDLYARDIDEVLVEGEEGYRAAKAFMKMLMPSHAKRVQPYRDPQIGLFHRFQVESQIDAIHSPIVQLRSGGYIVINQTEALVAIDVNSGRATRERNIEETAVRTNLEAAEEIARQLRLRDLAGLIVIDFIDMEEHRNQIAVERRLKEALKNDRARIQVGRISAFGLLEMSRQRLRPSLVETSTQPCPHCGGTGMIRSTESTALYVLRSIEEEGMRRRSAEICIHVPTAVALYILNQKRDSLVQLEARYGIRVVVARDDALIPPAFRLERLRAYVPAESTVVPLAPLTQAPLPEEQEEEIEEAGETIVAGPDPEEDEEERGRGRRRRRRRRRGEDEAAPPASVPATEAVEEPSGREIEIVAAVGEVEASENDGEGESDAERRRRRRGRRGGRRRGRREAVADTGLEEPRPTADTIEILPAPEPAAAEPTLVEARAAWPVETGAAVIETASLPALAGEPPPDLPGTAAPSDRIAPDQVAITEPSQSTPRPAAEAEQGVPYISERERELETASASAEQEQNPPPHPVETVNEKPANPRRGWWQRLIQP
jgi:ribonuclease E